MSMTLSAVSPVTVAPLQMARGMASSHVLAATAAAVLPAPDFRRFNLHYAVFPPQLYVQLRDPDTGEVTFQAPNEATVKMVEATQPVRSLLPDQDTPSENQPAAEAAAPLASPALSAPKREALAVTPRGDALNTSA